MSDSDDTDVLLLIPPDLFVIPSSDSDEDSVRRDYGKTGVVTEILEHVQSLENRISIIESRDNSLEVSLLNASLDSQARSASHPVVEYSPIRRNRRSSRHSSSLPVTPAKPLHSSSAKSSPGERRTISMFPELGPNDSGRRSRFDVTNTINANSRIWKKHGDLAAASAKSYCSASLVREETARGVEDRKKESGECAQGRKNVREMELSEVDELLQEMEATEIELAKRIRNTNAKSRSDERESFRNYADNGATTLLRENKSTVLQSPMRRLDFQFADEDHKGICDNVNLSGNKEIHDYADISLPDEEALRSDDTETMISSFKTWEQNPRRSTNDRNDRSEENCEKMNILAAGNSDTANLAKLNEKRSSRRAFGASRSSENSDVETHVSGVKSPNFRSLPNIKSSTIVNSNIDGNSKLHDTVDGCSQIMKHSQYTGELQQTIKEIRMTGQQRNNSPLAKSNENYPRKSQRLFTLSDFWDCDGTKSQEEMLRIRLEEEKFRREHCEHLIQELQKRLLEQQEKVAVAIRVDNEKNSAISQFQNAWSKLKQRWDILEKEHSELEDTLKSLTTKHQTEITDLQRQIKRGEDELSKALDLAAGYKEKSDSLVKEKLELLNCHADELEKYKSLVQEAELRYENLRGDYNKLAEKNRQSEEIGNNAQQELNKERLRSTEVRAEMAVIHKALDACEAELAILRQEKENLQLKIKEEVTRNGILEQNKVSMLEAIQEARNAEKSAKEETKSLVDRQEQIRSELRQVYQNQLEDVVRTKLREFQEQLDAAEMAFQGDLDTRQRAIAECAARKIKTLIDKHQLEINLLEEKHNEEKRLGEIQLAQASQKATMLEMQLSTQRATKTHLAEQLHSVMQKQWQQALKIISGGQIENVSTIQRLNAERIFEAKTSKRCNSACCNKEHKSSTKAEFRSMSSQNLQITNSRQDQDESLVTLTSNDEIPMTRKESKDDLRKYIKMILDMQQPNRDEYARPKYIEESNPSPPPMSREVPRKHYTKKEQNNGLSEESATWQRIDEQSVHDTSEYMQIPQSQGGKTEQQKNKPPWK